VGRHWAGHSSAARSVLDNELLAKPLREPLPNQSRIEYESWTSTISSLLVSAEAREIALNALELPGKLLTSVLPP